MIEERNVGNGNARTQTKQGKAMEGQKAAKNNRQGKNGGTGNV